MSTSIATSAAAGALLLTLLAAGCGTDQAGTTVQRQPQPTAPASTVGRSDHAVCPPSTRLSERLSAEGILQPECVVPSATYADDRREPVAAD